MSEQILNYGNTMIINTSAFHMTDEEFAQFCNEHSEYRIERTEDQRIMVMSPNFAYSSAVSGELYRAISNWNHETGMGRAFDASAGFFLKDGSMRSPDAAWIPIEVWKKQSQMAKESFLKYCPDFVAEIKSKTDSLPDLQEKMQAWIRNGTRLAWLIDPAKEKAWIYKPGAEPKEITGFDNALSGDDVLVGFSFPLSDLRLD